MPSLFDYKKFHQIAIEKRDAYSKADPFPHIVIDDFLPSLVAERLLAEFPSPFSIPWKNKVGLHSKKLACNDLSQLPQFTQEVLLELNSPSFLSFVETLAGIQGLTSDSDFEGGGLHQIKRGGFLKIHADFNYHTRLSLYRRLNLLLYLNKDWKEEYGGHLELWDRSMSSCIEKIPPIFNRCVIFNTTDFSYHGHPNPLRCPSNMTRKSIAIYYYTKEEKNREERYEHTTLYQKRPFSVAPQDYLDPLLARFRDKVGRLMK